MIVDRERGVPTRVLLTVFDLLDFFRDTASSTAGEAPHVVLEEWVDKRVGVAPDRILRLQPPRIEEVKTQVESHFALSFDAKVEEL